MKIRALLFPTLLCATLLSCSKKTDEKKVDPSNSNELQSVLVIPNSTLTSGNPPVTSASTSRPVIAGGQSSASVNAGNQVSIPFNYTSNSGYTNCYVQVNGATNGYYTIPSSNSSVNNGTISIPVTVPANVGSGNFCITYCIADAQGRVSNTMQLCVSVTGTTNGGGSASPGNGSFATGGQTFSSYCSATPASNGGGGIDVVLANQAGNGFVIYNMPTQSSGSFSFQDGYNQSGLWGAMTLTSGSWFGATKSGGTLTKTGAKSFTFSCTMYDLNTNQQKSVTGNGSWQ